MRAGARRRELGLAELWLPVVFYCRDWQVFARLLDRTDVLDEAGGADIFQIPPRHMKITAGADAVLCLRLSDRNVYRSYTEYCQTPIGNTAGPRVVGNWSHSLLHGSPGGWSFPTFSPGSAAVPDF
ncbi:MAG: DUF6151 family protein [Acidiferrobacterales bacterium]